ncbi:hypothetical protein [Jeotgalibaca porci]|uniref:hypothetical protein n=1 Tax=Jeotgalibaca porci TaxID=1868793 RepID=UPI0035A14F08
MKFEIMIKEQMVNQDQLCAWEEDLEYGDFDMMIGEVVDGEYLVSIEPVFYRDFGRVVEDLIILAEQGW